MTDGAGVEGAQTLIVDESDRIKLEYRLGGIRNHKGGKPFRSWTTGKSFKKLTRTVACSTLMGKTGRKRWSSWFTQQKLYVHATSASPSPYFLFLA